MSGRGPLEEHYASHPVYSAFPREVRRAGTVPIDFLRVEQDALDAVDPAMPFLVLALNVGSLEPVGTRFDCGDGWFGDMMRRGNLCVTPPDADLHCRLEGPNTILGVPLPMDALARRAGAGSRAARGRARAAVVHPSRRPAGGAAPRVDVARGGARGSGGDARDRRGR